MGRARDKTVSDFPFNDEWTAVLSRELCPVVRSCSSSSSTPVNSSSRSNPHLAEKGPSQSPCTSPGHWCNSIYHLGLIIILKLDLFLNKV